MRHLYAGAALLLLAGCAALPVVLSEGATAACAAQAAANVAGKVAEGRGDTVWAARFAEASKLAGFACAW